VRILATGKGDATERIYLARRHLVRICADDLPSSLGLEFTRIVGTLDRKLGPRRAEARMNERTARPLAARLFELWLAAAKAAGRDCL